MVYEGTESTVPWGKWWPAIVKPAPGGTTRGRPREEVEWMRSVSVMTRSRLCRGLSA